MDFSNVKREFAIAMRNDLLEHFHFARRTRGNIAVAAPEPPEIADLLEIQLEGLMSHVRDFVAQIAKSGAPRPTRQVDVIPTDYPQHAINSLSVRVAEAVMADEALAQEMDGLTVVVTISDPQNQIQGTYVRAAVGVDLKPMEAPIVALREMMHLHINAVLYMVRSRPEAKEAFFKLLRDVLTE